jgi:hypothetical protein
LDELFGDDDFPRPDSLFSLLREEGRAVFRPQSIRTTRIDKRGARVGYWEYAMERTFTAENIGTQTFGPVSLKGLFATRSNGAGELTGEGIYALADAITVDVRDAPLAGRPVSR